jgi:hypothetical protein
MTTTETQLTPADAACQSFLQSLDDAVDHLDVGDLEAAFIADHLDRPRPFTEGEKLAVETLRRKYAGQVK